MKQGVEKVSSKLRKGDLVEVIAGRDKGKRGKISEMLRHKNRAVVEDVNVIKRHLKPSAKHPQGGIFPEAVSIHLSNLMIVDPEKNRPTRIGMKRVESADGKAKLVRVSKLSGASLDFSQG